MYVLWFVAQAAEDILPMRRTGAPLFEWCHFELNRQGRAVNHCGREYAPKRPLPGLRRVVHPENKAFEQT